MSQETASKSIPPKAHLENTLIALCLLGSFALLGLAWFIGDETAEAQSRQWQLVFLSFSLALCGQWVVGGSPFAKKQQIAATCLVLAGAGVGVQQYYNLPWLEWTPFIVGYLFLFAAAELCAFVGSGPQASRRTIQAIRIGVVVWNAGWSVHYAGTAYALPDVANLYVAFSLLWTFVTAFIAWSEFCVVPVADPRKAAPPASAAILTHAK